METSNYGRPTIVTRSKRQALFAVEEPLLTQSMLSSDQIPKLIARKRQERRHTKLTGNALGIDHPRPRSATPDQTSKSSQRIPLPFSFIPPTPKWRLTKSKGTRRERKKQSARKSILSDCLAKKSGCDVIDQLSSKDRRRYFEHLLDTVEFFMEIYKYCLQEKMCAQNIKKHFFLRDLGSPPLSDNPRFVLYELKRRVNHRQKDCSRPSECRVPSVAHVLSVGVKDGVNFSPLVCSSGSDSLLDEMAMGKALKLTKELLTALLEDLGISQTCGKDNIDINSDSHAIATLRHYCSRKREEIADSMPLLTIVERPNCLKSPTQIWNLNSEFAVSDKQQSFKQFSSENVIYQKLIEGLIPSDILESMVDKKSTCPIPFWNISDETCPKAPTQQDIKPYTMHENLQNIYAHWSDEIIGYIMSSLSNTGTRANQRRTAIMASSYSSFIYGILSPLQTVFGKIKGSNMPSSITHKETENQFAVPTLNKGTRMTDSELPAFEIVEAVGGTHQRNTDMFASLREDSSCSSLTSLRGQSTFINPFSQSELDKVDVKREQNQNQNRYSSSCSRHDNSFSTQSAQPVETSHLKATVVQHGTFAKENCSVERQFVKQDADCPLKRCILSELNENWTGVKKVKRTAQILMPRKGQSYTKTGRTIQNQEHYHKVRHQKKTSITDKNAKPIHEENTELVNFASGTCYKTTYKSTSKKKDHIKSLSKSIANLNNTMADNLGKTYTIRNDQSECDSVSVGIGSPDTSGGYSYLELTASCKGCPQNLVDKAELEKMVFGNLGLSTPSDDDDDNDDDLESGRCHTTFGSDETAPWINNNWGYPEST